MVVCGTSVLCTVVTYIECHFLFLAEERDMMVVSNVFVGFQCIKCLICSCSYAVCSGNNKKSNQSDRVVNVNIRG